MDGADSGRVLQNDLDILSVWESRRDMEFIPQSAKVPGGKGDNPQKPNVVTGARYSGWTSPMSCPGTHTYRVLRKFEDIIQKGTECFVRHLDFKTSVILILNECNTRYNGQNLVFYETDNKIIRSNKRSLF